MPSLYDFYYPAKSKTTFIVAGVCYRVRVGEGEEEEEGDKARVSHGPPRRTKVRTNG